MDLTRPESVPASSRLFVDHGMVRWLELVNEKNNIHRIRIYLHPSGTLLVDADYVVDQNISGLQVIDNVIFMDDQGSLGIKLNEEKVYLKPLMPAYGGMLIKNRDTL